MQIKKIMHRIACILTGKKGIYGRIGKNNKFGERVSIHELSIVGNYNYIGRDSMIFNAHIGNYNSIAPGVKIGQVEHDLNCVSTSTRIFGPAHGVTNFTGTVEPSIIDHDVWIGANAIILQGVHVHTGAVIAAGAVVTKDVMPYSIVGGVPAKKIKDRVSEEVASVLLNSDWWQLGQSEAIKKCKELQEKLMSKGGIM